jgi:Ca2+-binding EF-hand superfamily protein
MNFRIMALASLLLVTLGLPQPIRAQEDKSAQKTPADVFDELDKNGDGKVTREEVPEPHRQSFERALRLAGRQSEGDLTKSQFVEALKPDDLKVAAPQNLGQGGGGDRNPAQLFQRFDRNRDGKLSLDEIPEPARPRYKLMFDRLGKQELSREEFVQASERLGRDGAAMGAFMRDPEGYFKRLDVNQDGKLTLEEVPADARAQLERWLTRLDKGKEGNITLDDLKKIVTENQALGSGRPGAMPGATGRPAGLPSALLRRLDTNGDGRLSKEEFAKAADLFDEFDRNHDGFLEPAELAGPATGDAGRPAASDTSSAGATAQPAAESPKVTPADKKSTEGDDSVAATAHATGTTSTSAEPARKPANRGGGKKAQGPLRKSDTDGDGKISRDEAQGRLKANFAKLDLNSDGFLDSSELRQALATLGPKT